ncbi:MAG: metallophosphoesterase [Bacillota bacterium]
MLKILFATDAHGSEVVFRKFLNALKIYGVNVGILMGDLCGKMLYPVVRQPDGTYESKVLGQQRKARTDDELRALEKDIATMGAYYFYTSPEELEELRAEGKSVRGRIDERAAGISLGAGRIDELFRKAVRERLARWVELAEERLKGTGIQLYVGPGNDDLPEVDEIIEASPYVVNPNEKKVDLDGYEMITLAWSTPTPWDTERECSEEELQERIDRLVALIGSMETAIFNMHVPPHGTILDQAPKLSDKLVPSTSETVSAGSKAVLDSIKKYEPLLGLHGHIHESKGVIRIGRTTCVNPGSEYSEGILNAVLLTLDRNRLRYYNMVSG